MKSDVLVKLQRDPLFGMTKDEYIWKLKESLAGRVEEAYIFGSFTGNDFSRTSDIDIILVCETGLPFVERNRIFSDLLEFVPSTDIIVYTPEEFRSNIDNVATGFWKSVKQSMLRIV